MVFIDFGLDRLLLDLWEANIYTPLAMLAACPGSCDFCCLPFHRRLCMFSCHDEGTQNRIQDSQLGCHCSLSHSLYVVPA